MNFNFYTSKNSLYPPKSKRKIPKVKKKNNDEGWRLNELTPTGLRIYEYVYDKFLFYGGYLFESESTIARNVGCSRHTVIRTIKQLRALALITTKYRFWQTLLIRVEFARKELYSKSATARGYSKRLLHYDNSKEDISKKNSHNVRVLAMMMLLPSMLYPKRTEMTSEQWAYSAQTASGCYPLLE